MERLFLQLSKEKLTNLGKFPQLNYNKICPLFVPLIEFQKKSPLPHYHVKSWSPYLQRGGRKPWVRQYNNSYNKYFKKGLPLLDKVHLFATCNENNDLQRRIDNITTTERVKSRAKKQALITDFFHWYVFL